MNLGLLLLRLAVGLTLAAHGGQKLFGWFRGGGIDGTAQGLEQLGFVPGRRSAVMAGLAEFGGGLLLALGLLTPLAAAAIVAVMLVAIGSVHVRNGFFNMQGGYEFPLLLGLAALSTALTGPGTLSIDGLLGLDLSGAGWAIGALLIGLLGGTIQLAARRRADAQPQTQAAQ
jgi:putative oxidoreductase